MSRNEDRARYSSVRSNDRTEAERGPLHVHLLCRSPDCCAMKWRRAGKDEAGKRKSVSQKVTRSHALRSRLAPPHSPVPARYSLSLHATHKGT